MGQILRRELSSALRGNRETHEVKREQAIYIFKQSDNLRYRELHEEDSALRRNNTARGKQPRRETEHNRFLARSWFWSRLV